MKYKYLADLQEGIPYRKSIRKHVGSVTATILIQQLDYHFAAYPDGFYKFLSPVAHHSDYRDGDSWAEELAFSEKEFRAAFDNIGVRHTSKTAYKQASNCFIDDSGQEKFYCSYHDKQNGLTWYFRNHDKVDALIEELIKLVPTKEPKDRKRPSTRESTVTAQRSSTVTDQRESTVNDLSEPANCPKVSYVTAQRSSTFIYKENTENTSKEKDSPTPQSEISPNPEEGDNNSILAEIVEPQEEIKKPCPDNSFLTENSKSVLAERNIPPTENDCQLQNNENSSHIASEMITVVRKEDSRDLAGRIQKTEKIRRKPDGSEWFPWEITGTYGWAIEEGFFKYEARVVIKYPYFKNMEQWEFEQELKDYFYKAHTLLDRKNKLLAHWENYQKQLSGVSMANPSMTVSEAYKQATQQSRLEAIIKASKGEI